MRTYWIPMTLTPQGCEHRPEVERLLGGLGIAVRQLEDFAVHGYSRQCANSKYQMLCRVTDESEAGAKQVLVMKGWISDFNKCNSAEIKQQAEAKLYQQIAHLRALAEAVPPSSVVYVAGQACRDELHPDEADSTLRAYQTEGKQQILEAWRRYRSVMFQMPTGTGKTRLFVSLIADLKSRHPDVRVLIVTHRKELVEQISLSLTEHYRLDHGILSGAKSRDADRPILVASVQTLTAGGSEAQAYRADYIIIDEAHHALADSYAVLWQRFPDAYKLGVTATPCRLRRSSFRSLFDVLIVSAPMRNFVQAGYLASYRYLTVSRQRVALQKINRLTRYAADGDYMKRDLDEVFNREDEVSFLYECCERYVPGQKGIVYAVNRDHAARITQCFMQHGVAAACIDSHTLAKERQTTLDDFRSGRIAVLCNVELFTEGFDCPDIDFVLLARPTRSLALYLQQVGRALRPSPGGHPVTILDAVGLYSRFGFPERPRDWQAHFEGRVVPQEDYTKPLGRVDAGAGTPMILLEQPSRYQTVVPMADGWMVGCRYNRQFILGSNQEDLVRKFEFRDIRREAEGHFSAKMLYRDDVNHVYEVRFTTELQLIPSFSDEACGLLLHAHRYGKTRCLTTSLDLRSPMTLYGDLTGIDGGWLCFEHEHFTNGHYYPRHFSKTGEIFQPLKIHGKVFIETHRALVAADGEEYVRVPNGFRLFYRIDAHHETVLYDARLHEIARTRELVLHGDRCVLIDSGKTRVLSYVDYLFDNIGPVEEPAQTRIGHSAASHAATLIAAPSV